MSAPEPVSGVEMRWQVNDLELAGLSWGSPGERPVLALHGWLDNAASFSRLAPLLDGCHVVALDLTGHGRSARRSPDASYQIWDDLPEVQDVIDALGWDSFCLIGHSRGAIISTLFASAFPERIERMVLLDGMRPQAGPEAEFPKQMRRALRDKPALLARKHRVFADIEEASATRSNRGLSPQSARILVERNLRPCEGGFTWTTDARLHGASAVKLTDGQIQAVLNALTMPVLCLLDADAGEDQLSFMREHAHRYIADLALDSVPGGHHFHMEEASSVAAAILTFFSGAGATG